MISFPENYFDTETRCRFTIGKLMKSTWAAQLEVLEVLKAICAKYNITFFAGFGTLIGAVRHKGFIPWDDDLDVVMRRPDYMRFLSVVRQELPPEYQILSMYYEEEWNGSFSRLVNRSTISTSPDEMARYHGCPFIVGVDVFPIDYYPKQPQEQSTQWTLLDVVKNNIRYCDALLEIGYSGDRESLKNMEVFSQTAEMSQKDAVALVGEALQRGLEMQYSYMGIPVDTEKSIQNIRNQLFRIYDKICMMYQEEECDEMVSFQGNISRLAGRWKKEWFDKALPMGYDVTWIPVPVEYDKVLRATFGDYRNPVYHGGGHDYPYYSAQLELLQKSGKWSLEDGIEAGVYHPFPEWEEVKNEGEISGIPEIWKQLMESTTGKPRKIVLYATSLMGLLRGEMGYIRKLQTVMEIFHQCSEVLLWWIPCETKGCLYREQNPTLFEAFDSLCQEYQKAGWGIFDDSGNYARAVLCSDAMYGDYGEVFELYKKSGKPIMIQDETISK